MEGLRDCIKGDLGKRKTERNEQGTREKAYEKIGAVACWKRRSNHKEGVG